MWHFTRMLVAASRMARRGTLRRHAAFFSTEAQKAPRTTPPKTVEEAKADREPEYPIMLVNPRARLGDAAPVVTILAFYLAYCMLSDVTGGATQHTEQHTEPDSEAEEVQKELPDGRLLMKDGSIRRP